MTEQLGLFGEDPKNEPTPEERTQQEIRDQIEARRYPHRAGFTAGDTDKEAANKIEGSGKAATLRRRVVKLLKDNPGGLTADEASVILDEIDGSIRPRFSELFKRGILIKTDETRPSRNGNSQRVLKINPAWDGEI